MTRLGIAILGLGTIGQGVARLLGETGSRLSRKTSHEFEFRWALVRDPGRPRGGHVPSQGIVTDPASIWEDPAVDVVVETMGGIEPARGHVLEALKRGKHVVTANKALLAEHGPELLTEACRRGRALAIEASVGGGIPILQAIQVGLAANQVQAVSAILNGTCNFILTAMSGPGMSYTEALRQAQQLGYAEPDPTLDVDGTDTAHKLAVLAQLAFGTPVRLDRIPRQGIDHLDVADIRYAGELGYTVKLLAQARVSPEGLQLRVAPRLVRQGLPLAEVRGPYNAIRVVGDAVGDTLFYGRGAGALPTASAIVADLMDVALGRAAITTAALERWLNAAEPLPLAPAGSGRSRSYLRFNIADRAGVLGNIANILGNHGVSIASVIQHDPGDAGILEFVPLVVMTHMALESDLAAALAEIDRLETVAPPSVCLGVDESADFPAPGASA